VIFDPETPGGLRLSIDCSKLSSSATADDMLKEYCLLLAGLCDVDEDDALQGGLRRLLSRIKCQSVRWCTVDLYE